jgi:hypothetical protein
MISVIVPYYRAPAMLRAHLNVWSDYSAEVLSMMRLIVVDDGSPEPAEEVIKNHQWNFPRDKFALYRITQDIPWNRGGARNLGSMQAQTPWLLHMDIDHLLPSAQATALVKGIKLAKQNWYRFERYRVGEADETRRKDAVPDSARFAKIKPHGDSYLCPRELYWRVGGYDEDYSGCLGGGSPFLAQMEAAAPVHVLPVALHVHTRYSYPDASVSTLDRDTREYVRRKKEKQRTRNTRARNPLRFNWEQVI